MDASAGGKSSHRSSVFHRFSTRNLAACISVSLLSAALLACSGGSIQGISGQGLDPATGEGTALEGTLGGVSSFQLTGSGVCDKIQVDFGDGTAPEERANVDFANPATFTHTYTGWAGKKTVKAGSLQNCVGAPEMIFTVKPAMFSLGYAPTATANCGAVPNKPGLRKNTKVHITALRNASGGTAQINFGCPLNGCIRDEDGDAGQAAANWPFPNLRPYSLVLKVGSVTYQGGTDATFITTGPAAPLEVCRNESQLGNHTGGWGINIDVDESRAQ